MDWGDVSFFLAALRTGSFTQAALVCEVKQSTVSRRVAALEKQLGGSLFHRTARGLHPTELAEEILPHAELVEYHMAQMNTLAFGHNQTLHGLVKIAMVPTLARLIWLPALRLWRERFPALSFECVASVYRSDLLRGEADIALRFLRPQRGDLIAKKVATLPQAVLAHRDYLASFTEITSPEELDWIDIHLPFENVAEFEWLKANVRKAPVLKVNDYGLVIEAVVQGIGAAIVSKSFLSLYPELREVQLDVPELPPQELWIVTHKMLRNVPRIRAVWDALEEMCHEAFK